MNTEALIRMAEDFYERAYKEFSSAIVKGTYWLQGILLRKLGSHADVTIHCATQVNVVKSLEAPLSDA
ncbi:MAG: hypothetical protein QXS32_07595 [Candidatus Nezhaarchaeales archaeon]